MSTALLTLFEKIRSLTLEANESVKENKIEQCNHILVKRQNLLENLFEQVSLSSEKTSLLNDQLIELLTWIQEQDKPNIVSLIAKKSENTEKSIKQVHANKAIKHYKNIR